MKNRFLVLKNILICTFMPWIFISKFNKNKFSNLKYFKLIFWEIIVSICINFILADFLVVQNKDLVAQNHFLVLFGLNFTTQVYSLFALFLKVFIYIFATQFIFNAVFFLAESLILFTKNLQKIYIQNKINFKKTKIKWFKDIYLMILNLFFYSQILKIVYLYKKSDSLNNFKKSTTPPTSFIF